MKNETRHTKRQLFAIPAFLIAAALTAQAQVMLTDGNSSAYINLGGGTGPLGMNSWTVNGVNQLNQQWFWYHGGNTLHGSIDSIGAPTFISTPNFLSATYANNAFSVRIDYLLSGGMTGGNDWTSDITESISIVNHGVNPLKFKFYQYSDFNLLGTAGGDSVKIFQDPDGKFFRATQVEGMTGVSETIDNPSADRAEAALYNSTLVKLTSGMPVDLNNNLAAGVGDVTWALQWEFIIPGGTSQEVFKDKRLSVAPIPEPGVFALLGLGVVAFLARRRS